MDSPDPNSLDTLQAFFAPRAVAVVGASTRLESVGHAVLRNLLGAGDAAQAFGGPVYAVNVKGGEILGLQAYRSLVEIGAPVDLIVVCVPPAAVPPLIEQAGRCGVRAAIIMTAGFAETGAAGAALQHQVLDAARAAGIRIIGPNCLGVIRPALALNASFAAATPTAGGIGLLSQSGALVSGIISYAQSEGFGLSAAVSLGDKSDVDDAQMLRWLAADRATTAIALYVEAFSQAHVMYGAMAEVARIKPIVALKGGVSAAGARAASSHTGSIAGSQAAYAAAFAQTGVLQAPSIGDFMAWARALAAQPPAPGQRLAVLTNAGGPGVLAADEASRQGLELARLSDETRAALDAVLPAVWSHGNPVDIIGDAPPERFDAALRILRAAPEVDGIIVILTVQAMTDPQRAAQAIVEAVCSGPAQADKPVLSSFLGQAGGPVARLLDRRGIPEFDTPERAVGAMAALMRRGRWLRAQAAAAAPSPVVLDVAALRAQLAPQHAAGGGALDLAQARALLASAGIRYNDAGYARDVDEAVALAGRIGYPVALKLVSPEVIHKTDAGAVALAISDAGMLRQKCEEISNNVKARAPGARLRGFTVEQQVGGTELIVGARRDPDFGALLMVGVGGVLVEVYRDVAFRLAPLSHAEALAMLGEIRAQALLDGVRGLPPVDRDALAAVLVRLGALVEALPEIVEVEINPLVMSATQGLVAIDARVIVAAPERH
jgi:acetyl coenzyme A synthetase (ADP forming)-like protein